MVNRQSLYPGAFRAIPVWTRTARIGIFGEIFKTAAGCSGSVDNERRETWRKQVVDI